MKQGLWLVGSPEATCIWCAQGLGRLAKQPPKVVTGSLLLMAPSLCHSLPPSSLRSRALGIDIGSFQWQLWKYSGILTASTLRSLGRRQSFNQFTKVFTSSQTFHWPFPQLLISQLKKEKAPDDSCSTGERPGGARSLESLPGCCLSRSLWATGSGQSCPEAATVESLSPL